MSVTRNQSEPRRRSVFVVLPFDMSARVFMATPVAGLLERNPDLEVTWISRNESDVAALARTCGRPVGWRPLFRPFRHRDQQLPTRLASLVQDGIFIAGFFIHQGLIYRFNRVHKLSAVENRRRQSRAFRRLAQRERLVTSWWQGFPLPQSKTLLRAIYRAYHGGWFRLTKIERLMDERCPDLLVIMQPQSAFTTPYLEAARARGIPILGMIGSWDQPLTKGPVAPGLDRVLAQSRFVRDSLVAFHGFDRRSVEVIGWPQMDVYASLDHRAARQRVLEELGLPTGAKLILFGAYARRIGGHEPSIIAKMVEWIHAGRFGPECTLLVRSHPLDSEWEERIGDFHQPPNVIVEPPKLDRLDHLGDLLVAAHMVISSAGSICLDGAACDTPAIGLAYSKEPLESPFDSPAYLYENDHYRAIIETGGVRLVRSDAELESVIAGYLADPSLDREGRQRLRELHLDPLDGRASERLAGEIAAAAGLTPAQSRISAAGCTHEKPLRPTG